MADAFDNGKFQKEPVLGIVRGVPEFALDGVLNAALEAGLSCLEITLNTENASRLIRIASGKKLLCIGAGTVLSLQDAQIACDAGARFLVSPTLNEEVAVFCRENKIPFFPGAYSPTEIEKAWSLGAEMVKVFPASRLGPDYFKEILGPFPDIRLMAVGGIDVSNIALYLKCGASGLAVGGSVFTRNRMENGNYEAIRKGLEEFLLAVRSFYHNIGGGIINSSEEG